ncbi:MAG: DUF3467 domain-containing protein [Vicinamibacterales bacterium]
MSTPAPKQLSFTIVPDESTDTARDYANFCAVGHTPFDMTLTFCDVRPLTDKDIRTAEESQVVKAPVVAKIALPFSVVPGLINALQEQMRAMTDAQAQQQAGWPQGPLH